MSFPLFDPIDLPPNHRLVDVNSLPDEECVKHQAAALALWVEETGEDTPIRDWNDNEGIFVVYEGDDIVGIAIIMDVENA